MDTVYESCVSIQRKSFLINQKSIDLLGYSQTTSLKDGLFEMWEWAKKQPMHERMKWDNYEITKGIYEYWK